MKGSGTNGFKQSTGSYKIRGCITARNLRRLARKNKDVIHGRHSEQMDREAEKEKDSRDSASVRI